MKPIWYFVGLLLVILGAIILISGIYLYFNPSPHTTVLGETHPSIWWGLVMLIAGALFLVKNWKVKVE
jgi:drug/metabolite transporter (DMT)-like permease